MSAGNSQTCFTGDFPSFWAVTSFWALKGVNPVLAAARTGRIKCGNRSNFMDLKQQEISVSPRRPAEDEIELPIDGVLDLHTFSPKDVKGLLQDYLSACREKGIFEIRVIHGKGTGTLRKTVHSLLEKMPEVVSFRTAPEDAGGWGATLVQLKQ